MQRQNIPLPDNLRLLGWFLLIIPKRASLVAQLVKNLPAVQETRVRSLGWEDPLEKEMATHSSIFAWKISWKEEPGILKARTLEWVAISFSNA